MYWLLRMSHRRCRAKPPNFAQANGSLSGFTGGHSWPDAAEPQLIRAQRPPSVAAQPSETANVGTENNCGPAPPDAPPVSVAQVCFVSSRDLLRLAI